GSRTATLLRRSGARRRPCPRGCPAHHPGERLRRGAPRQRAAAPGGRGHCPDGLRLRPDPRRDRHGRHRRQEVGAHRDGARRRQQDRQQHAAGVRPLAGNLRVRARRVGDPGRDRSARAEPQPVVGVQHAAGRRRHRARPVRLPGGVLHAGLRVARAGGGGAGRRLAAVRAAVRRAAELHHEARRGRPQGGPRGHADERRQRPVRGLRRRGRHGGVHQLLRLRELPPGRRVASEQRLQPPHLPHRRVERAPVGGAARLPAHLRRRRDPHARRAHRAAVRRRLAPRVPEPRLVRDALVRPRGDLRPGARPAHQPEREGVRARGEPQQRGAADRGERGRHRVQRPAREPGPLSHRRRRAAPGAQLRAAEPAERGRRRGARLARAHRPRDRARPRRRRVRHAHGRAARERPRVHHPQPGRLLGGEARRHRPALARARRAPGADPDERARRGVPGERAVRARERRRHVPGGQRERDRAPARDGGELHAHRRGAVRERRAGVPPRGLLRPVPQRARRRRPGAALRARREHRRGRAGHAGPRLHLRRERLLPRVRRPRGHAAARRARGGLGDLPRRAAQEHRREPPLRARVVRGARRGAAPRRRRGREPRGLDAPLHLGGAHGGALHRRPARRQPGGVQPRPDRARRRDVPTPGPSLGHRAGELGGIELRRRGQLRAQPHRRRRQRAGAGLQRVGRGGPRAARARARAGGEPQQRVRRALLHPPHRHRDRPGGRPYGDGRAAPHDAGRGSV
ncbi:MAG: TonB-dependent siderophore receptor, partial [uncultured Gemmatimonadaceae bacterium]